LDRLQLPESERASLAAEEQEIAELQRRLDESDTRYSDLAADNIDLKQEVRDLQLEMEGNTSHRICLFTALRIIVRYVLRAGVCLSVTSRFSIETAAYLAALGLPYIQKNIVGRFGYLKSCQI